MNHHTISSSLPPAASDGHLLFSRAAFPRIKATENCWKSLWMVTLSSSPFWQARALPSLTTSATAEGCQAPKLSTATNLLKSALIKVPQKSHLSEERAGAQSLFGKWPNRPRISFNSTSLRHIVVNCCESHLRTCCCQIHQCARIGEGTRGVHANLGNARILRAPVTKTPN